MRASIRYFCGNCGLELEHRQSPVEKAAWFVNAASLLVLIGGLILRENSVVRVPEQMLFVAAGLVLISLVAGVLAWIRLKHFVAADARSMETESG